VETPGLAFRPASGKTGGVKGLFRKKPNTATAALARIGKYVAATLDANPAVRRAKVDSAQVYQYPDFLDKRDCDMLIERIEAGRRPSTLLASSYDPNFRTSDSCDLDRWAPEIEAIDHRIAAVLGIDPERGETLQGQRYAPGQQFRAHYDWFNQNESYWAAMKEQGGQRTWTGMVYLNDVEEGGATWFPNAGVRVAPKRGLLLIWNNMTPEGAPNTATLHEGTAVVKGVKYIVTKWFREDRWILV
jgi:prolyl 4-hydroxylase